MEEDIKILEKIGCISKLTKGLSYDDGIDFVFALNKLIEKYRELESEIQHKNDQLFLIDKQNERHSILKSLIKKKIEELEEKEQELSDEQGYWGSSDLLAQIEVLQELMEDK